MHLGFERHFLLHQEEAGSWCNNVSRNITRSLHLWNSYSALISTLLDTFGSHVVKLVRLTFLVAGHKY